jgi:P-type Mg2+ transporter
MMHLGKLINGSATRVGVSRLHRELAISSELFEASQCDPAGVLGRLGCTDAGLDETEAARRLKRFGLNQIARERRTGVIYELINRTKNPLNALLLTLAVISYFLGDVRAAIVIATMVLLSIFTAFIQEHRSNQAAAKLRALVKTTASVKRQGQSAASRPSKVEGFFEVPIEEVVPGDLVALSAGDMIPADLRVLSAKDLYVNQSALTGEAMPVEKSARAATEVVGDPFALPNICFMGGNIVSGYATGVIIKTGGSSYFGQLADRIAGQRIQTSFEKGIDRFTWLMIRFILVLVPSVFLINGISKGDWLEALLFALAVAVGLTPEMLPMIVTANLAKGAIAMSRKRVIVKRLHAIQNFGAMDVLCTDKTGTLTQDRINPQAASRHPRRRLRPGAGIRLPEQPLSIGFKEPPRCRGFAARGARKEPALRAPVPQARRNTIRLRAPSPDGRTRSG